MSGNDEHRRTLAAYVSALGIENVSFEGRFAQVELSGLPVAIDIKAGGSRLRGRAEVAHVPDVDKAVAWLNRQPLPPSSELALWGGADDAQLRLVWERAIDSSLGVDDPIRHEITAIERAWRDRAVARFSHTGYDGGDPRSSAPQQAWLVIGDQASWPSDEALDEWATSGDAGVFENLWTAAKQTQVGDLLLFYFTGSRRSVCFVARAASAAFYASDIHVAADRRVRTEQWWVYCTPLIAIEPIPFAELDAACDGHLMLRGRSGKFLAPAAIEALTFNSKERSKQDEVDEVVVVPSGRADLPDPDAMSLEDVIGLAGGALKLESDVERYVVEPLLRHCLEGTEVRVRRQFPIGKKRADFVILDGERPVSVIEVKLAINDSGDWGRSPDLAQVVGYAAELDVPGILIDTQRIVLVDRGASAPSRVLRCSDLLASAALESLRSQMCGR